MIIKKVFHSHPHFTLLMTRWISRRYAKRMCVAIRTEGRQPGEGWEQLTTGTGFIVRGTNGRYHIATCGHVVQPHLYTDLYHQLADSIDVTDIRVKVETRTNNGAVLHSATAFKQIHVLEDSEDVAIIQIPLSDISHLLQYVQILPLERCSNTINVGDIVESESYFLVDESSVSEVLQTDPSSMPRVLDQVTTDIDTGRGTLLPIRYLGSVVDVGSSPFIACDFGDVVRVSNSGSPLFTSTSIIGMLIVVANYPNGQRQQWYLPAGRIINFIKRVEAG
eukprot:TRINITY_DN6587_c0_g5_i1.p1 TRINITY_DN6587_c0_g5~~TRINITY_DN6587_c0_g5_i1.p1  ORF type:complete len:278 (+),score=42.31 TRINITY_DN6587_c0_g5_i1:70-903(+)